MKTKKQAQINYLLLAAGLIMLVASLFNYSLNEDFISTGIFSFAGLGFILMAIAARFETARSKRLLRYAYMFFVLAALILVWWLVFGKLNLIN